MLPAQLAYGYISIYGIGSTIGISGIVPADNFLFGIVDDISPHDVTFLAIGDSVMFNPSDQVCKLTWSNSVHTIISENKIILKEIIKPKW